MTRSLAVLLLSAAFGVLCGASGCDESINNDDVSLAVTYRGSLDSRSLEGNDGSTSPAISGNGRILAFVSVATTLVPNPVSGVGNIYVRDLGTGLTELVSVTPGGTGGNGASFQPALSSDGRFVVFASFATDLVTGLDDNLASDVYLRDRQAGTTVRISQTSAGGVGNFGSGRPAISPDGRFIVFESLATNLEGTLDTNNETDIFLWDRQSQVMERISFRADGGIPTGGSFRPDVSGDGRFVVFDSGAADMVTGDAGSSVDVFIRDRQLVRTDRVSVAFPFGDPNDDSFGATISDDGRYVAFNSKASNLTSSADVNNQTDVFVRDLATLTTQLASRSSAGALGFGDSQAARLSRDGRRVAFQSSAPNLVGDDTNGSVDIFLRNLVTGQTQRISVRTFGVQAADREDSVAPSITADGAFVAFESLSEDLVDDDSNGVSDVFYRGVLR
jgi:Tol biopolymer transport system component